MSPPHKAAFKLICPKNATLRNLHGKVGGISGNSILYTPWDVWKAATDFMTVSDCQQLK